MTVPVEGAGGLAPAPLATREPAAAAEYQPRSRLQATAAAASYWIARVVEAVMGVALVGVAVMVCMQVLFRFVLGAPLHYTEEVARYLTVWAALLGASLGVRSGTHFSVRYIVNLLPGLLNRAARVVVLLIVAAFLIAFVGTSSLLLETALVQSSPAARIPMVLVYAAAPVGSILMLFFIGTELLSGGVRALPSERFEDES